MFADFTSADRRKKVVTYGRSSRPPATANPAPIVRKHASSSPERPRKHVTASISSTKALSQSSKHPQTSHPPSLDPFEIPSDNEVSTFVPKPIKKPFANQSTQKDDFDVPISDDDSSSTKPIKKIVQPLRKPIVVARTEAPRQKPANKARSPKIIPSTSSDNAVRSEAEIKKPPTHTTSRKQNGRDGVLTQKHNARVKAGTSSVTSAVSASKTSKPKVTLPKASGATLASLSVTAKDDVFELPVSDEEVSVPAPKLLRRDAIGGTIPKRPGILAISSEVGHDAVEPDDPALLGKRKRSEPIRSTSPARQAPIRKRETSMPRHSHKHQKKTATDAVEQVITEKLGKKPARSVPTTTASTNKPQRSRQRTVPVLARPTATKGQSCPAKLSHMLPEAIPSAPSPVLEMSDIEASEEGTMYDIPDSQKSPIRTPRKSASGSVTPRQKALFNNLLANSSSQATPLPSIQSLQLSDKKPSSLLSALSRSKSDLSTGSQARKPKLIDSLKTVDLSSEDDEDDEEEDDETSTSDSDDESRRVTSETKTSQEHHSTPGVSNGAIYAPLVDIDVDMKGPGNSQSSQVTSRIGARPKCTYASEKRSYLEEFNPEDELLMSMDIDQNFGFDSQRKEGLSEDEDDPSQAKAHHELKRQGQQALFNDDAQMHVEDISCEKNTSIRRSAMLDLATKMENTSFTGQLLDSSWAFDMITNMSAKSEIVFDFAAAIAVIYTIRSKPTVTITEELSKKELMNLLLGLLSIEMEIRKIAKDRKTNMSRIAQESVGSFRDLVERSIEWCPKALDKVSPQIAALKALDMLLIAAQTNRNKNFSIGQEWISKLIDLIGKRCKALTTGSLSTHDTVTLTLALSILQTSSAQTNGSIAWRSRDMQCLAECMPLMFKHSDSSLGMLGVKICMNLTNNKPEPCESFSGPAFVQSLIGSTLLKFELQDQTVRQEARIEILDNIILNLGTLINLAEFSDKTRVNVDDGQEMVGTLVTIFVKGIERANQVWV